MTRLRRLAEMSGAPVPGAVMGRFTARFGAQIDHFAEYGVSLRDGGLSVLTLGCGKVFGAAVGAFASTLGFNGDMAQTIVGLQRDLDPWMMVRLSEDAQGGGLIGLYFRRAMDLQSIVAFLKTQGVSDVHQGALQALAALVGAHRTGIIAAILRRGEPVQFRVYLHAHGDASGYGERGLVTRLSAAFTQFDLAPRHWQPFIDHLGQLRVNGVNDAFVSLLLCGEKGVSSPKALKVDLLDVAVKPAQGVLDALGLQTPGTIQPRAFVDVFGAQHLEHMGFTFHPDEVSATIYAAPTRVLSESAEGSAAEPGA